MPGSSLRMRAAPIELLEHRAKDGPVSRSWGDLSRSSVFSPQSSVCVEPTVDRRPWTEDRRNADDIIRSCPATCSTPRRASRRSTTTATWATPGSFRTRAAFTPTGYRGKLWTMRQFAGFGTPEETNERYRRLLAAGGTGLSVAFDLPTLMGRDPDHELSRGEVGKCGVNVTSLADMEALFADIDLGADHDVDDDQRAGVDAARDVSRRRRAARAPTGRRCRARSRTTSSRSSSRRRSSSTRRDRRCGS